MALNVRLKASNFYPRPPRGGRHNDAAVFRQHGEFLSTPSARRATYESTWRDGIFEFLSTPSARRATPATGLCPDTLTISIHALREEGDTVL